MNVRFRFSSAAKAEEIAMNLPIVCRWSIVKDRTTDAYLEVPESYEEYIERYFKEDIL